MRVLSRSVLLALVLVSATSCDDGDDEAAESAATEPLLGLYNLPISRRNQGSEPSDAVRVEISPDEYRADGVSLMTLERGRPESAQVEGHVLVPLRDHVAGRPARRAAAIWIHTNVPYITLVQTLHTLKEAGVSDAHFAVRAPGDAEGWMSVPGFLIVDQEEEIPWETNAPQWSEFTEHWRAVYDSCQAGANIDCDAPYLNIAEGGTLAMELWTRGQGMKVTFSQIPPPEEEEEEGGGGGGGVALIEGVRAAPPPEPSEEDEGPSATSGSFNFRQQDAAAEDSAFSASVQHVCGNTSCQAEVVADATGASMRVVTMIGAAFPDGFSQPEVAFRIPEMD